MVHIIWQLHVQALLVGVDIADEAIEYADANYKANNLTYRCIERADYAPLPFADAEFDAVLSFQVIEHISDIVPYLSEIRRVLKPGGVFVCATPDRSTRLLPKQKPWNMWHVKEYSEEELGCALVPFFSSIEMQCMSGMESVLNIEIRRTKKLMWLTLPLTLPFVPEALRIVGLKLLKRLSGNGKKRKQSNAKTYSFGEEDLVIGPKLSPSVNLIAIAHKL